MDGVIPYFPRISFFIRAFLQGEILVAPNLIYDKQFHANRAVIPGSNGLITLSIPILGGRNVKLPFSEVKIDNSYHWQRDHYRTLSSVYGRSPFFSFYEPELHELMSCPFEYLLEWNLTCLKWTISKIKFKPIINFHDSLKLSFEIDKNIHKKIKNNSKVDTRFFIPRYTQLFEERIGFSANMSILDLLFNLGPDSYQKLSESII